MNSSSSRTLCSFKQSNETEKAVNLIFITIRIYNGTRTPECFLELTGFPKHPVLAQNKSKFCKEAQNKMLKCLFNNKNEKFQGTVPFVPPTKAVPVLGRQRSRFSLPLISTESQICCFKQHNPACITVGCR